MTIAAVITFVGILVFLAHLFVGVFSRTRIPDVLLLILIGLVLGPVVQIVNPDHFGRVGPVFVNIALALILFEGGLGMRFHALKQALAGTLTLTLVGFFVTVAAVTGTTMLVTELGFLRALILGSIVGGTSSAVVIPLVRQLKMGSEPGTILILESALTDVLCIVFALGFMEAFKMGEFRYGMMAGTMLASFVLAALLGTAGALVWSLLLKKVRTVQNSLFTNLAFVFVVFGLAEMLGYSGAIASLAFGIILGNADSIRIPLLKRGIVHQPISFSETEKAFFSEIVFLLKTFFFVYLGLSIQLADTWLLSLGILFTLVIFAMRIPVTRLCLRKSITRRDASLSAVMVPKGLAPAVLASIPVQQGLAGGELLRDLTYSIILISIIMTSALIFLLDKTPLAIIYHSLFRGFAPTSSVETSESQGETDNTSSDGIPRNLQPQTAPNS